MAAPGKKQINQRKTACVNSQAGCVAMGEMIEPEILVRRRYPSFVDHEFRADRPFLDGVLQTAAQKQQIRSAKPIIGITG